ncbi:BglG family transcription antiterminator [Jeotgalibacillus soli]|uniref:Uncharacterized protein n=1 Tax=Jeotgalibacillus soli TaxID=889306 RepID=A0A0C2VTB3_9BACL|nr:PRD domain-containing protein [Jeotgalibacillus soli]KIL52167.1 hypothetical protein KP78_05370 [Jeotgalibacillus soli]
MDYISARERKIIEWLLRTQHQFTTIRELADALDVSSRTIHRELKKVESALAEYDVQLEKQSGTGIRIRGTSSNLQRLDDALQGVKEHDLQQEERLVVLLHYLIRHDSPVKTALLVRVLNVATATLMQDLDKLSEQIKPYGLSILRKRGYGIELVGSERERRKALANLMIEQMDTSSLYSMVDEHFIYPGMMDDKVAGVVDRELLIQVERLIMDEVKDLPYTIADSAYLALVIHISLAIQRIKAGERIELDPSVSEELSQTVEYAVAESLARSLSEEFELSIPKEEVGYITIHLRGAKRREQLSVVSEEMTEWSFLVQQLIQQVGQRVDVDFSEDHSLFEGLIAHLEPAIHRAEEGTHAFNPLKESIKEDYPILFNTVKETLHSLFPNLNFSDGELAFLVLHFASSLEIRKEKVVISALVVCSSGIGTSKMLASRLKKEFPEITKITLASLHEAKSLSAQRYDLIMSTVGLVDIEQEYLLVSPLLPSNEVEKVKRYIQLQMPLITKKKGYVTKEQELPGESIASSLEEFQRVITIMLQLLNKFTIIKLENDLTEQELLQLADQFSIEKGVITSPGVVANHLKEREELGGLGIPGTGLALYHCRSADITEPLFMIIQLASPVEVKSMDQQHIQMKRMLLLLAPDEMHGDGFELMSIISASIIEDDKQLAIYTNGEKDEIHRLLEQKYYQFIRKKLNSFLEGPQ